MRWQSRLRCRLWNLHDTHCTHPLTSGWVIDMGLWAAEPAEHFATYQPPEVMPKHAAPRITWTQRLKAWWNHLWRRRV